MKMKQRNTTKHTQLWRITTKFKHIQTRNWKLGNENRVNIEAKIKKQRTQGREHRGKGTIERNENTKERFAKRREKED